MLALLKEFFTKRKKTALKRKSNHVAILPASPSPSSSKPVDTIETITTVPFWYAEHGSFDTVEFVYPSESLQVPVITEEMRDSIKKYVGDVCPKPDGSMQIYAKLNDPKASVKEITALVSSDPMLAAQVLKLINSAAFGLSEDITSIGRAVTLLGFQNVKSVVLNHSIRQGTSTINDELSIRIREHSHMSSAMAYHLSETVAGVDRFTVSTIALLHDMGKILYPMIVSEGRGLNFSITIPQQVVEALIASVFAELWKLPESISSSIEYLHHPCFYPFDSVPDKYRPLVTTLSMANLLANCMGFEDGDDLINIQKEYLTEIHEDDSPARWIDENTATKIESTRGVM